MDAANNLTKRNIGGKRVVCRSTILFPKADVFNHTQVIKSGVLVFNVRGGSFYSSTQYNETNITSVFQPDRPTKFPQIKLTQADGPEIILENYQARFLKFNHFTEHSGLVFRFVHLTEQQLDKLNSLTDTLPQLDNNEEHHVNTLMSV